MKKLTIILHLIVVVCFMQSCEKENIDPNAGQIVSNSAFENADMDEYDLKEVSIEGDIMRFTVSYGGGCDESGTEFRLLSTSSIYLSLPPQRDIKLSFTDNDQCEAYVTRTLEFDITAFRENGGNEIILRYEDANGLQTINYAY